MKEVNSVDVQFVEEILPVFDQAEERPRSTWQPGINTHVHAQNLFLAAMAALASFRRQINFPNPPAILAIANGEAT